MSAEPIHRTSGDPGRPAKNVLAIRAALSHPRDIEAFEAGLPVVVTQAHAARDWSALDDFIHRWWLMAIDSLRDPEGRRRMWETADRLNRGERVNTTSAEEFKAMLRARLARGV